MNVIRKSDKIFLYIIIGIYILSFLAISGKFDTPYLWFDEAGQFFMSKGLNYDSDPLEEEKSLAYVVKNNSFYNFDPGGFSIILHFWSKVSSYHIWLRFLPFLFFIGIVLSFIYFSYLKFKEIDIALLMGFITILIPMVLRTALEIRAFSMEGLGTILGVIALEKIKDRITYKNLLMWSFVFSFFITSRYSEIVVCFIISIYVIFLIFNSNMTIKKKLLCSIIYSLPLVATLFYIYFFALLHQNANLNQLSYLPYISNNPKILITPRNFLFLCVITLLTIIYFLRNRYPIIKKYEMLLTVTIITNVLFIILSIIGIHPWVPYINRCISPFLLVVLSVFLLLGEFVKPWFTNAGILKYSFVVLVLLLTLYIRLYIRKDSLFFRKNQKNTYDNFVNIDLGDYDRIYVDRSESASVRYLFEYGKLRNKSEGIYPDKFTFGKYLRHSFYEGKLSFEDFYKTQPKMNDYLYYDLLITPELFEQGDNDKWALINGTTNFYIQKDNYKNR